MATASGKAGIPMPPVRLSFSRFPLRLLGAGQTVNSFRRLGLRHRAVGVRGVPVQCRPVRRLGHHHLLGLPPALLSPLLGAYIDRIGFKAER